MKVIINNIEINLPSSELTKEGKIHIAQTLLQSGISKTNISSLLGLSRPTLRKIEQTAQSAQVEKKTEEFSNFGKNDCKIYHEEKTDTPDFENALDYLIYRGERYEVQENFLFSEELYEENIEAHDKEEVERAIYLIRVVFPNLVPELVWNFACRKEPHAREQARKWLEFYFTWEKPEEDYNW